MTQQRKHLLIATAVLLALSYVGVAFVLPSYGVCIEWLGVSTCPTPTQPPLPGLPEPSLPELTPREPGLQASGDAAFDGHLPGGPPCLTCHVPPDSHRRGGLFACSACHNPAGWAPAAHPESPTCDLCHDRPHQAYPVACDSCHRRPGVDWTHTHTESPQCDACHARPTGHPDGQCSECHTPTQPFAQTPHPDASRDCLGCHEAPHRDFSARCPTCHPNVGRSFAYTHSADSNCTTCHTPPASHPAGIRCLDCHTDFESFSGAEHPPQAADCLRCHTPPHRADYPVDCTSCHPQRGASWTPVVHTDSPLCSQCHARPAPHPSGECSDCHQAGGRFTDVRHPGAQSECLQCHTPPHRRDYPVGCSSCHPEVGVTWVPPIHTGWNVCLDCHEPPVPHPDEGCDQCHDTNVPFPETPHPGDAVDCSDCHSAPHRSYDPSACTACHNVPPAEWLPIDHPDRADCTACHTQPSPHFTGECPDCHTPTVPFPETVFPHGPASTNCEQCHTPTHRTYPAPATCAGCHKKPGESWSFTHPNRSADCADCHALAEHPMDTLTCQRCHGEFHNGPDCTRCHRRRHSSGVLSGDCLDCHNVDSPILTPAARVNHHGDAQPFVPGDDEP